MSRKRAKKAHNLPDFSLLVPNVSEDPESLALDEKVQRYCELYRNLKRPKKSKKRRAPAEVRAVKYLLFMRLSGSLLSFRVGQLLTSLQGEQGTSPGREYRISG